MSSSTFSYAQAAKGLGSANTPTPSSKVASSAHTPTKSAVASPTIDLEAKPDVKMSENSQHSKQKDSDQAPPVPQLPSSADFTSQKPNADSTGSLSPASIALIESSTSTLHREDDLSSIPNASSESTWENVSQSSNMVDKSTDLSDKTVTADEKDNRDDWVKVQKSSQEAPPPSVNVWKRRMDAAKAPVPIPTKRNGHTTSGESSAHRPAENAGKPEKSEEIRTKDNKRQEEDSRPRRTGSRKSEETTQVAPPPMQDETSWPTPELAQGEKFEPFKKPAEKNDQPEAPKASGKKTEWKKVEVQHSVVWNTPLPNQHSRRGGRSGGRGGRDGPHSRHSPPGARTNGSLTNADGSLGDPAKRENGHRSTSPTKAKRNASEEVSRRESRAPNSAKEVTLKETANGEKKTQVRTAVQDDRHPASAPIHNTFPRHGSSSKGGRKQDVNFEPEKRKDAKLQDISDAQPPNSEGEKHASQSTKASDEEHKQQQSDTGTTRIPPRTGHGHPNNRRTSLRGRNGYHGFHAHHSPNPAHGGYQGAFGARSPPGPHDNLWGQPQHGSRGFRGPRAQSVTSYPNGFPSAGILSPLNTFVDQPQMYDWQTQAMSAMPYSPMLNQYSLFGMVQLQLEYYFSVDNLCHDMYLRQHMDAQGFVLLPFVANFNRVRQLTQDMDLLKYVCQQSNGLEHRLGADGKDRIRKREGWEKWVLENSKRDATAQHDGMEPAPFTPTNQPAMSDQQPFNGVRQSSLPYPLSSPHALSMNSQAYPGYFRDASGEPQNGSHFQMSPPPINQGFPYGGPVTSASSTQPTYGSSDGSAEHQKDSISNAEVDNLVLMTRPNATGTNASSIPAQTLSNGSTDSRSMGKPDNLGIFSNGASSHENDADKSSFLKDSFSNSTSPYWNSNICELYWARDNDAPSEKANKVSREKYVDIRANALEQRQLASEYPYDMVVLYQFWSHFLVHNFNTRMYEEFRQLAEEDVKNRGNSVGTQNLVRYYWNALLHPLPIRDAVLDHLISRVQEEIDENSEAKPAFNMLRSAWRNGALNLQTRKKISNRVDLPLRTKLDA